MLILVNKALGCSLKYWCLMIPIGYDSSEARNHIDCIFYCWITHNNLLCWEIHCIKRDVQYQVKIQAPKIFSVKPELAWHIFSDLFPVRFSGSLFQPVSKNKRDHFEKWNQWEIYSHIAIMRSYNYSKYCHVVKYNSQLREVQHNEIVRY